MTNEVEIIWPDDPRYLDEFYRGWGVGQSVTLRQDQVPVEQPEMPQTHPEPQQEPDRS